MALCDPGEVPQHELRLQLQALAESKLYLGSWFGCWTKNRGGKTGTPKWMVKIMENPMNKWMIWGYHYFWEHPFVEMFICFFRAAEGLWWKGMYLEVDLLRCWFVFFWRLLKVHDGRDENFRMMGSRKNSQFWVHMFIATTNYMVQRSLKRRWLKMKPTVWD